jgi:hypothetical protein
VVVGAVGAVIVAEEIAVVVEMAVVAEMVAVVRLISLYYYDTNTNTNKVVVETKEE